MQIRLDPHEKLLIAVLVIGMVVGFREQLIYTPIVTRLVAAQRRLDADLGQTRRRIAIEETAHFINENMPDLQQSDDKFALLKNRGLRPCGQRPGVALWMRGTPARYP